MTSCDHSKRLLIAFVLTVAWLSPASVNAQQTVSSQSLVILGGNFYRSAYEGQIPGLIDGHCHLLDFVGELYLHLGITTCPDITQNEDEWTMAQRDGTNLGKIRGPRIWSTGARLVGPPPSWALRAESGHLIKTPDDARAAVRKKKEMGLEIVKFNEYVSPEAVKAGAEEANHLGLPVTCHCLDVFLAAEAGFAGVEQLLFGKD